MQFTQSLDYIEKESLKKRTLGAIQATEEMSRLMCCAMTWTRINMSSTRMSSIEKTAQGLG
jgi:hypothetical protein